MYSSYFRIAVRQLAKNKIYSFINVAGLSLGLACAVLMILYTKDELSFDRFHERAESIYQIAIEVRNGDGSSMDKFRGSSFLHGPQFQSTIPEIETYVRFTKVFKDIKNGGNIESHQVIMADSNFFSFFTFPFVHGDPKTALFHPSSIVITQDAAIRYFGTEDALNRTILIEDHGAFATYTVTGIAKRPPQNSSIQFDEVIPFRFSPQEQQANNDWLNPSVQTFLRLHPDADPTVVGQKMQTIFENQSKEAWIAIYKAGYTGMFYHSIQPITSAHLAQDYRAEGELSNGSNPLYSIILSGIALFLVAIACINFVNLSIARSGKRAKEIGVRKVVGSGRRQLVLQFLGESFILCSLAFIAAIFLAYGCLPMFSSLVNKHLSFNYLLDLKLVAIYFLVLLITGLLAGAYPALILSGFNPIKILYNKFKLSGTNYLQKGLVVFQFALATAMIVGTIIVYMQFEFLTTKDPGYDASGVLKVTKKNLDPQQFKTFKDELEKENSVIAVAPYGHGPMSGKIKGKNIVEGNIREFAFETVNEDFLSLLRIPIVQGRNFSSEFPSDATDAVLVNEAFVKMAGWDNPIGETVDLFVYGRGVKKVVGVVKDYHYASFKDTIKSQLFVAAPDGHNPYDQMLIRIKPNTRAESLERIENVFKKLFPMSPYTYDFYDDINRRNYETEAKWKQVILISSLITAFIAGIGLFGLSILTAERRFKEIGIRKILGASVGGITITLSKDFGILVALGMVVGMPIALFLGESWLETYAFRIAIGPGLFVGAGLIVLLIAVLTTGYNFIKTGLMNPVIAIRNE